MSLNPKNPSRTAPNKDAGSNGKNPQLSVGDSVVKDKLAESVGIPARIPNDLYKGSHPLSDVGNLLSGQVEGNATTLQPINLEEYAPYFGNNPGYVSNIDQLDKDRAFRQGSLEQFGNASARVALNVIPETVSQLANAADLEDYYNSNTEVGNWITNALQSLEQDVDKQFPIYRENPDKPLDVGDNAWWFENGSGLVKSAAAFVGAGYVTGNAINSIFGKAGQAAKWLSTFGKTGAVSEGTAQGIRGASVLANAMALNQAEGVGIGVDQYNKVYNQTLQDIKGSKEGLNMSDEDIDKQARLKASEAATSAINFNKINILLNITSAGMFMKTP